MDEHEMFAIKRTIGVCFANKIWYSLTAYNAVRPNQLLRQRYFANHKERG